MDTSCRLVYMFMIKMCVCVCTCYIHMYRIWTKESHHIYFYGDNLECSGISNIGERMGGEGVKAACNLDLESSLLYSENPSKR